ncbi:hypothetical protein Glittering_36 [Bacillus phage Glittering]|uniref:Uncharacterized protein n=1 Tax=Bacillus phage Glittering TaxID=2884421 RepID=U5PXN8_9CAUD|nr:hypothetical protein Glittering_36 [Bacillus phage Glittering]AGY47223.1 hypothetical protein Glittering_36 [Bacillus phage Glittering]
MSEVLRLREHYKNTVNVCHLQDDDIDNCLWMLQKSGLTFEMIYFGINYLGFSNMEALEESPENVGANWSYIKAYFDLAKTKRGQAQKDGVKYDPENKPERRDSPTWFREGIDKHYFE